MPPRSNEFQKLIVVLQRHLDANATVTESAMLQHRLTGAMREVDVLVSGSVGGLPVCISVECRDRSRPANVTWVEEMHTKHSALATNQLVLVSHRGFTKEAVALAKVHGIQLHSLEPIGQRDPECLFPTVESLIAKGYEITIEKVTIHLEAEGDAPGVRVNAAPDTSICFEEGRRLAAADVALQLFSLREIQARLFAEATPEHKFVTFGARPPRLTASLVRLDPSGPALCKIAELHVVASCRITVDHVPIQRGRYHRLSVAWGPGKILGKEVLVVATRDPEGGERATVEILPARSRPKKKNGSRRRRVK